MISDSTVVCLGGRKGSARSFYGKCWTYICSFQTRQVAAKSSPNTEGIYCPEILLSGIA
jgi:hypothetical protein